MQYTVPIRPVARDDSQGVYLDAIADAADSKKIGAGNEIRTRDPDLGKVVLYQLSYSRLSEAGTGMSAGSRFCLVDGLSTTFLDMQSFICKPVAGLPITWTDVQVPPDGVP